MVAHALEEAANNSPPHGGAGVAVSHAIDTPANTCPQAAAPPRSVPTTSVQVQTSHIGCLCARAANAAGVL